MQNRANNVLKYSTCVEYLYTLPICAHFQLFKWMKNFSCLFFQHLLGLLNKYTFLHLLDFLILNQLFLVWHYY